MRNRMVLIPAATATLLAALLAGCGSGSNTQATTTTATAAGAPAAPIGDLRDAQAKDAKAGSGAALTVTDIGIEHHQGFDRIVFQLGGAGTPGWHVGYTDKAVQDGSGKTFDITGKSLLEVKILGAAYPFDTKVAAYSGPNPTSSAEAPAIAGVYQAAVYEGASQGFIALTGDRPKFAVGPQTDPDRVVIDIAN
ncbi:hypothetical protein D5S18_13840 [Nocardia panacis]|uniref:AMIN-like domain-containing protein n=1 Tax=Nocardia panacis TaxID=2340916 RepID=A0A3A4KLN9_9NOCA|nr:hypothetical protein [Nocardia panacis]RJO75849.1 hypothetical protein D5S18_13840 [Nocardia panacis]